MKRDRRDRRTHRSHRQRHLRYTPQSPPFNPPAPPPTLLEVADWLAWTALLLFAAVMVTSVALTLRLRLRAAAATSTKPSRCWSSTLARLLQCLATLGLVSAALVYYGEARFSVMTRYSAAGMNTPFVRLWNDAEKSTRSALHYGMQSRWTNV